MNYLVGALLSIFIALPALAQQDGKPLVVSVKKESINSHGFYSAKAKIVSVKVSSVQDGIKESVVTVAIAGTMEGNLCLDNKVALNVKSLGHTESGSRYHERIRLDYFTYKQHYGRQAMLIGSSVLRGCTSIGIRQLFVNRVSFSALIAEGHTKSATFDVAVYDSANQPRYKFRVQFGRNSKKWKISEL